MLTGNGNQSQLGEWKAGFSLQGVGWLVFSLDFYSVVVTFSDDARYFVARDGGFFVTAKDGTVRHVDQLGKQFYLFPFRRYSHSMLLVFSVTNMGFPRCMYFWHLLFSDFEYIAAW